MDADDIKKIEEIFKHHIGVMSEDFQHKLDIVAEGHQMLSDKLDRVEATLGGRLDRVESKVDAVAADLSAHRADTEAHGTVYRLKESGD
jgi:hypothetical protein